MIGMAIASQHARLLRLTNGPYGDAPGSRGRHVQYRSFGAVARWMATSIVSASPSYERPRIVSRTPPLAKMLRAHQNSATYAAPSANAHAVASGSNDSGCAATAAGIGPRRSARSISIACGESRSHNVAGNGTSCAATTARQAMSDQSSTAPGPRPIRGRSVKSSTTTPTQSGTIVQRYAPAKAKRVQPIKRRGVRAAAELSERRFGVVVLVLMAVIPRIVVLILGEIDFVQNGAGVARPALQHRIDR